MAQRGTGQLGADLRTIIRDRCRRVPAAAGAEEEQGGARHAALMAGEGRSGGDEEGACSGREDRDPAKCRTHETCRASTPEAAVRSGAAIGSSAASGRRFDRAPRSGDRESSACPLHRRPWLELSSSPAILLPRCARLGSRGQLQDPKSAWSALSCGVAESHSAPPRPACASSAPVRGRFAPSRAPRAPQGEPCVSRRQPYAIRGEPPTSLREPCASRGQPCMSRRQLCASRRQPCANSGEPCMSRGEPCAANRPQPTRTPS